ncbi:E3 ubiquitin-protein ligase bre1 [Actinomortierella ambigua]|uniref:E3 ubiquitin protein ligase n=1 Tax=Actinomortierella ambigua TaxID=1343610 RepID=A0A9P6QG34_9FUNG|nr:E3 ubiquitin-protein ligase bre1 [Actinomortierella ambigua]
MEDISIRKRRLTDDGGIPIAAEHAATNSASPRPFQPPSNKRQFIGSSSPAQSNPIKDDTEAMTPAEEVLHNFQKEAIWRQMQEYKRENARAQETIETLKKSQADYESHLSTISIYWEQFLDDLKMLMARVNLKFEPEDLILKDGTSFASFLLNGPEQTAERKEIKDITEDPSVKESGAVRQLSEEHTKLEELYKKGQSNIDQLQAKCHDFTEQVLRLRNELEMTRNRLQETADELDDSKERLRRVEKSFDRERSKLVQAVSSGSVFGENYNGGASASTTPGLNEGGKDSDATKEELLQFRELARTRLVELDEMKMHRIQLKNEVDALRLQLTQLPDERIQDSAQYKTLLVQMQYVRNDADHYRNEATKLRADLDELHASRRKFMDNLEMEEKTRRATLEAELKKLENDISRVRDSRDKFQQMYEARCTKDDYEMQQNQEIRKIANTRKDRILALTTDIHRLQTMLAAKTGDREAFAFYLRGPTDKQLLDDMRNKLKAAEDQIQRLTLEVEAAHEAATQARELEAALASEKLLKLQVEELTKRLTRWEALLGEDQLDDAVKGLMAKIQQHEQTIQQLELRVQAHEAVQTPLVNELHTVATAWAQLEEATSRKVIDLAQKEDLIYKLLSDKTRQESKCALLIRAKDASANMTAVLKRQSDMQMDQIRRLEDRERNLNNQVATLEREQATLHSSVTVHKGKLQEFTAQNSAFKEKFARQEERLAELQTLLKERTEHYEHEAHARKRSQEEAEMLRRKVEEHSKQETSSAESEAAKQAARYLKLLKCPACDVNFKSHVILRCMHVFCKSCMDNQMEYRQRKCPTCRENFGAKDVKEIYL